MRRRLFISIGLIIFLSVVVGIVVVTTDRDDSTTPTAPHDGVAVVATDTANPLGTSNSSNEDVDGNASVTIAEESASETPVPPIQTVQATAVPPTSRATQIDPEPHAGFITSTPEPTVPPPPSEPVAEQAVIVFAPQTTDEQRAEYLASIGGEVTQNIGNLDTVVVNVAPEALPPSSVIRTSTADYYVTALNIDYASDPYYPDQWGLRVVGVPEAWMLLPDTPMSVTVAVIDSGVCLDHPDLAGHILSGYDYVDDDTDPDDPFGHGCSVAGIIAASTDNNTGIAGIAPHAQILPLRVLNANGVGTYSDVAAAIVDATDQGVQVINLSLGGVNASPIMENAVQYATERGVMVVAAAGNNGMEQVFYPAAYEPAIAVGSIDPDLRISSFSNYGPELDVLAPGRDIMTTALNGSYARRTGTSFAAPYVSGAAALAQATGITLSFDGGILSLQTDEPPDEFTPTPTLEPTSAPTQIEEPELYMRNPAAIYCIDLGYSYETRTTADGDMGVCVLPDATECEQWDFLAGTCGATYSYCATQGLDLETRSDGLDNFSPVYAVCVDENGLDVGSVSDLSALDLRVVGCEDDACIEAHQQAQAQMDTAAALADDPTIDDVDALSLPSSFDWRNEEGQNWLTNVRNQASCGSCWAFSTVGSLESVYNISRGNHTIDLDLSEQHLVSDCCAGSCSGGWPVTAMNFVRDNGITTESCLAYTASNSTCSNVCNNGSSMASTLHTTERVITGNASEMKSALLAHGPLNVYLGMVGSFDSNNVYHCENDDYMNHAVVLVGYNDAGGYWIIRNSWGSGYNGDGYFHLGYGECDIDGIGYSTIAYTPVAPTIVSPSNGATVGSQVTFQWNSTVPIRNGYDLRISQFSNPESGSYLVNVGLGENTTSYTYNFNNSGTYYWHLRVKTASFNSAWVTRSLTVDSSFCGQVTQIPASECNALASFYDQMNGANWTNNSGWGQTITPCDWHGVTCSGGHVTALQIRDNNVSGSLPSALQDLTYLQILNLWSNNISGALPNWLGYMTSLREIDLGRNNFNGVIPWELGNLSGLERLGLEYNALSGAIPSQIGNLTNLWYLNLSGNNLDGAIPSHLGNLTSTPLIYLSSNQLTGTIPASFENLNPSWLSLAYNQLSGAVPSWMGYEGYYYLNLSGNNFTSLPSSFINLTNTRLLYLNDMSSLNLTAFPSWLDDLTQLEVLQFSGNNISGAIPTWIGNFSNLKGLNLSHNNLSGSLPFQMSYLTNLEYYLYLNNNQFTGAIPTWIGNFINLEELNLANNQFDGAIPSQIGNLTVLRYLWLNHNLLGGEVPYNITYLTNLSYLDIGYNWLYANNTTTHNFLDVEDPDWESTQGTIPGNDLWYNATDIGDSFPVTLTQDIYGSSVSGNDPTMSCVSGRSNTVWYVYTPAENSQIRIDTTDSNYDTVLAVYTGAPPSSQVACDDDGAGNQKSVVNFSAYVGVTYYIMVADFGSYVETTNTGLTLHISSDNTPPEVNILSPLSGTALNQNTTTIEAETSLDATIAKFWVWYDPDLTGLSALADDDKQTVPSPPPSDLDTVNAQEEGWVYIGEAISDGNGRWSITWDASGVADQWVSIWVYAYKDESDPNPGFDVENGLPLDRTDPDGYITAPFHNSVQSSPLVTLSAEASDNVSGVSHVMFHQRIQIAPGITHWTHLGTDSTYPYAINWDIQGMAEGWVDVDIRVVDNAGNISPPTTDTVGFTIDPPPANDLITSAQPINVKSLWQMQDILGSTVSASDPAACAPYVNSVWYTFTENFEREVDLTASGMLNTVMAVYTGTEGNLTQVTCNDDFYGQQSRVAFTAQAGVTYYVMVGKYGSQPVSAPTTLYLSGYSPSIHVRNSGELISALEYANSNADYDHITLNLGNYDLATPYDEFNALPTIDTMITIEGNGQTIRRTGSAEYRLFNVGEAGSLRLYNITLANGFFNGNEGGAIRNQGYVELSRTTLQNNIAYWGGGVTNWGTLIISESNLFNNRAWNGGGAIDNPGTQVRITNSYIGGNRADWGAGVVSWGTLDVYTTRFSDNQAGYAGGAIRAYGTTSVNWSVINNNRANNWGGGISIYNASTTLNGVTFSHNNAFYGGAIHNTIPIVTSAQGIVNEYPGGPDGRAINAAYTDPVHTDRQPEPAVSANVRPSVAIYNGMFRHNFSSYGGAIYNYNGDVSMSTPTFSNNSATHEGGAVFNTLYSRMDMFSPVLEDNYAYFSAGAIANSATLNLFTPTLRDNEARLYNGGAIVNYADLMIDSGVFSGNYAGDSGGAVYNAAQLTVDSTLFWQNSAYYNGGAIVNTRFNGFATINNATFEQNSTGYNGGAISNQDAVLNINGSQFIDNSTSYDGGAIQVYTRYDNGTFDITGSFFTGNIADYGGAIHYHTESFLNSSVEITSSTFNQNIGRVDGGAVYTAAPLTMSSSCITNNSDTAVVNGMNVPITVTQNWWGVPLGPSYYTNFGDSLTGPAFYIPYTTLQPFTCDSVADADLAFEMTASEPVVIAGDSVNVAFSVTNLSSDAAPDVRLRVALSPDVTYITLPAGCSADGAVIRCDLGTLPAGGTTGLTLRLQVSATAVIAQSIQAHVSSGVADLFLENNDDAQSIDVIAVDDLLLSEQDIYASFQDAIQNRNTDVNFVLVDVTPQYIEATIRTRSAGSGTVQMHVISFDSRLMTLEISGIQAFNAAQQAAYEAVIRRELPTMFTHALSYGVFNLHGRSGTITEITLSDPGMIVTLIP